MSFPLSILDKCPRQLEEISQQALQNSVALARLAEQAGYYRDWAAEHHNSPTLASPSPEIVLAWLAAHIKTLRLGAGGVMSQHYSPYSSSRVITVRASAVILYRSSAGAEFGAYPDRRIGILRKVAVMTLRSSISPSPKRVNRNMISRRTEQIRWHLASSSTAPSSILPPRKILPVSG